MVLKPDTNKRDWQPREQRLISEFLASQFPTTPYLTRVRLGSVIPELVTGDLTTPESRLVRVFKRYADALVLMADRTIIIEAKIRLNPGVITYLTLYEKLFRETPEFKDRWQKVVERMLVYAIEDPVTIEMARYSGIRCVPYHPVWVDDYLKLLAPRERRAPR